MALPLDPRIAGLIAGGAGPSGSSVFAQFTPGDVHALRRILDDGLAQLSLLPAVTAVSSATHAVTTPDGHRLGLRWYTKDGATTRSAVVFLHGGARVAGSIDLYDPLVRTYVDWTGVPFLAVDYRLAPEWPGGTAAEDGITGLRWLVEHADLLGVDPARIAVMGDSAGGGIAAAVAILARDRRLPLTRQILLYPMLDDRTDGPDPHVPPAAEAMFSFEFNRTAWSAVLGADAGTDRVSPAAAPARADDLAGLPPAYIEVGELDIFRDEDVAFAQRLWRAGVSAELHVHAGYPHAFDVLLVGDDTARRHRLEKIRVIGDL